MRKSRFTESQIIGVLKQVDSGQRVEDACREHGISAATYYNWKAKYGGMEASDLRRMKPRVGPRRLDREWHLISEIF